MSGHSGTTMNHPPRSEPHDGIAFGGRALNCDTRHPGGCVAGVKKSKAPKPTRAVHVPPGIRITKKMLRTQTTVRRPVVASAHRAIRDRSERTNAQIWTDTVRPTTPTRKIAISSVVALGVADID